MADPKPSFQTFALGELAQFTREGTYATDASPDFHLFYVGRDDVHGILKPRDPEVPCGAASSSNPARAGPESNRLQRRRSDTWRITRV